jgi:hypothetical protein
MTKKLDSVPHLEDITRIILENQISTLASRMKTIQGMLAQCFIMRFGDSINIEFASSKIKLKGFPKFDDIGVNNNYKSNKSAAIFYTQNFLSTNIELNLSCPTECTQWAHNLNIKKKDDLCDCFLQGNWYRQRMKSITFFTIKCVKFNDVTKQRFLNSSFQIPHKCCCSTRIFFSMYRTTNSPFTFCLQHMWCTLY